jgi:putative transcriptional regulator
MAKGATSNEVRKFRFLNNEMTQSDLAKEAGVSRQTIVAVEKGDYTPSLELAFRIAYVFKMPLEEIFKFHPELIKKKGK